MLQHRHSLSFWQDKYKRLFKTRDFIVSFMILYSAAILDHNINNHLIKRQTLLSDDVTGRECCRRSVTSREDGEWARSGTSITRSHSMIAHTWDSAFTLYQAPWHESYRMVEGSTRGWRSRKLWSRASSNC